MKKTINNFKLVKSLLEQAIKEKKSLNSVSLEKNLSTKFISDFTLNLPKYLSEKEKETLLKLKEKHKELMKRGSKSTNEDEKKKIAEIYYDKELSWDEKMAKLCKMFGKSERRMRYWLVELGFKNKQDILPEQLIIAKDKKLEKGKKIFLITSAQNATPINKQMLIGMQTYAKHIGAQILCIPFRYKNVTSLFTENQKEDDWWDNDIVKYLTINRHNLNNNISILADVKIQPTSSQPLQGLDGMTGDHSSIVGHPRLELKTVPVMNPKKPKLLFTTGAITKPNFTESKAGAKGSFHHSLSFAIVEIKDSDTYFFRQVPVTNEGEFIDLFYHVKNGKVNKEKDISAVVLGDIHVAHCDPRVTDITLNDLFKKLKPDKVFLHDVVDGQSISHHNNKDPFLLHKLELEGKNDLGKEIDDVVKWLKPFEKYDTYIVASNHHFHLDRFLCENDFRHMNNFKNAIPYMEYSLIKLQNKAPNGILAYIINKHYPKFKCLNYNDVIKVNGWLLSNHGDKGANGSRGSVSQFSKLSTKNISGHNHSPTRIGGAISVGTSTHLKLNYTEGLTSWLNAHALVNRLEKAQIIIFFDVKGKLEYTMFK